MAFFNIIYRYMNSRTLEDSRRIIDKYARNEGTTWENMRLACNLNVECVQRDLRPPTVSDIFEREKARLVDLSDALAVLAIEQNAEVAMNPSSIGALWEKLGHPHPVNEEQWADSSTDLFQKMVDSGLRISHGATQKGIQCYCPVIRRGGISSTYIHAKLMEASLSTRRYSTGRR